MMAYFSQLQLQEVSNQGCLAKQNTINQASQTPDDEGREGHAHYFTSAWAKFGDAVQFCARMGINYVKRDVFQISTFLHVKAMSFYVLARLPANYTTISNDRLLIVGISVVVFEYMRIKFYARGIFFVLWRRQVSSIRRFLGSVTNSHVININYDRPNHIIWPGKMAHLVLHQTRFS